MRFVDSPFHRILAEELAGLGDPVEALPRHQAGYLDFLAGIPETLVSHAYAPGKWTVGQVVGHLADTQLVFLGRILFIARGQKSALPGFDEASWAETSGHRGFSLARLREIHAAGAAAVAALVASLPPGTLALEGDANGVQIRVDEILCYLIAHERHHVKVLRERYLGR
jgi:uncharacterized damage-inducible protein DinB